MKKIVVIGHSHVHAVDSALSVATIRATAPDGIRLEMVRLTMTEFRPTIALENGVWELNQAIVHVISREDCDFVVSCIGGNDHNVLGLVNHPNKFDFVLPGRPELPIAEGHEILPSSLVASVLHRLAYFNLLTLASVRRVAKTPVVHLESPPPVPSEEHIRAHPSSFRERIERFGVSPAVLRYKLWRVHSAIYKQECDRLKIRFLPVPPETQDADGMLVQSAWNPDPTHGNTFYGMRLLEQIAMLPVERLDMAS